MHCRHWRGNAVFAIVLLTAALPVKAQNYVYDIDNSDVAGKPVEQPHPLFPGGDIRSGQEGWVRLSFVISPDGRTLDPVVIDSIGGAGFEESARAILADWLFEAPAATLANNTVDIRFEIYQGRDRATSNFMRRYRQIMMHLTNEETAEARERVDQAGELGGWNLYEATMLSLMEGRVAGAEGNATGKLENYRRALGVANVNALRNDDRRELLVKLFELQSDHRQYAAARQTLALLLKEIGSGADVAALAERITALESGLADPAPMRARATIYNPCDCAAGEPLWTYRPARQSFSFAALDGNVERFEVRCEHDRLQGAVDTNTRWSLPEEAGSCRVFVFGDDGARFEFVEHGDAQADDPGAAPPAVGRSDVLDRRN
jgi:TonB family protein